MKQEGFEFLDHTADVQAKSWGRTLEEAISQIALSLMATISPDLQKIQPLKKREISIIAEDKEALIFDFLSELLYIFDVDGLIFSSIKVQEVKQKKIQYELHAVLKGEKFDVAKHEIGIEVKAITYSFMQIKEMKEKVEIIMIFDI
ncbi:MAG: archease [Promethearchaeota archaeon]